MSKLCKIGEYDTRGTQRRRCSSTSRLSDLQLHRKALLPEDPELLYKNKNKKNVGNVMLCCIMELFAVLHCSRMYGRQAQALAYACLAR